MIKKVIILGTVLFIVISALLACSDDIDIEPVTLEGIKNTLTDAGYTINENEKFSVKNSVGSFSFTFDGSHGKINLPVIEFTDKESAEDYAKIINADGNYLAIVNERFLTMAEAHHGVAHANEKTFLEDLIAFL